MRAAIRAAGFVTTASIIATASVTPAFAAPGPAPLRAKGHFDTQLALPPAKVKDLPGNRCELSVNATVTFTGTLSGQATGTTTAIIFSTCEHATTNPPGTFLDTFRFSGPFVGAIRGTKTAGSLKYSGMTAPGGDIRAAVHLDGDDGWAHLRADGTIAGGNDYSGVAMLY